MPLYLCCFIMYNATMYENLSEELTKRIAEEKRLSSFTKVACPDGAAVRRRENPHDDGSVLRPSYVRDTDKIMNCPYYNRYADKTQVFSFYKNDDITRRGLHVQLVSRIARTIGGALNLNCDLIEAIALGHDIGHTPFGHTGEKLLDELYNSSCGRRFSHNVHSVRVLDRIFPMNISLQTLSGIASHDGELELERYSPVPLENFKEFDALIENCYLDKSAVKKLVPSTLEGCVVRISDIIAYVGKDRQDAERAKLISESDFQESSLGNYNAQMVNNLMVNIIENSYGKNYIRLDAEHFAELQKIKRDNYAMVYGNSREKEIADKFIKPMMQKLYAKFLKDLKEKNLSSFVYKHHIDYISKYHYRHEKPYIDESPDDIVCDYIASMTDDYFTDLFEILFPKSGLKIKYKGYFE